MRNVAEPHEGHLRAIKKPRGGARGFIGETGPVSARLAQCGD